MHLKYPVQSMWGWNILNHNQFESTNNWIFLLRNQAPSTASVRERRIAKTTLTVCATSISKDTHFLRRWLLRFFLWFWDPCIIMRNLTCPRSRQFEHAEKKKTHILGSQLWYMVFIPNRSVSMAMDSQLIGFLKITWSTKTRQRKNSKPSSKPVELHNWSLLFRLITINHYPIYPSLRFWM